MVLLQFLGGKTGVFDIGELVELLHEEKAEETVVITIPPEMDYADYMLIVTVRFVSPKTVID